MRALGLVVIVVGVLAVLIGSFACFTTLTSDYASSACRKAEMDKIEFDKAKTACGTVASDCYKQMTIGLTSDSDCENRKDFMRKQLMMSIVPVVFGVLLSIVGFFMRRRKPSLA